MTPKEKAKELVEKLSYHSYMNSTESAKQCALIAVDEIITIQVVKDGYWQQVKTEIGKL